LALNLNINKHERRDEDGAVGCTTSPRLYTTHAAKKLNESKRDCMVREVVREVDREVDVSETTRRKTKAWKSKMHSELPEGGNWSFNFLKAVSKKPE
jgi:hypothetical protein